MDNEKEITITGLSSEELTELISCDDVDYIDTRHSNLKSSEIGDFGSTIFVFVLTYGFIIALFKMSIKYGRDISVEVSKDGIKFSSTKSEKSKTDLLNSLILRLKTYEILNEKECAMLEVELKNKEYICQF